MKSFVLSLPCCAVMLAALPAWTKAAQVNIATVTCAKYENEMVAAPADAANSDPINTVMWLFGYSVAKSGAHVMYGDALAAFGFSLDAECKSNPSESLMNATAAVKPSATNPMDLTQVDCATFAKRHADSARGDPDSARTIMMWLFGFTTGRSGGHVFDAPAITVFEAAFNVDCAKYPERNLYDELSAIKY